LAKASEVSNGRLDLDDLSPQVTQHSGGMWARQHSREVENANSLERAHGG
jgi:hypothetical protein